MKFLFAVGFAITRFAEASPANPVQISSGSTEPVPHHFQPTSEVYAGPTATGRAPFLAQNNPAPFGKEYSFVPNAPIETSSPISGNAKNKSIFQLQGQLSPYFPNPDGFGVDEYPLPAGCNISQMQMLSRHGSRYPTSGPGVQTFGESIKNASGTFNATGALSFLNTWSYELGAEILVPLGHQELFDSGILHYYQYGQLYNPNSKIIARTTSQDRMLKSAEYFMAGFFGLDWARNATLEVIIEAPGFSNTLAGNYVCNNSQLPVGAGGFKATKIWEEVYLKNATERIQSMITGYNWTTMDTYNAQTMCPYETVALGYSPWCDLFTYEEWLGFEYSIDLTFYSSFSFGSPMGRAIGIGYVEETLSRLENHSLGYVGVGAQDNVSLTKITTTLPLNQTLYFDFSHDVNMMFILTAFGFTQFAEILPETSMPASHNLTVSHLTPFGARLDIEVINAPYPVVANRSTDFECGCPTTYVHFLLNQRTLPLGVSFPECGLRADGWCELSTFLEVQQRSLELANYDFACNGNYPAEPWGTVTNGAPVADSTP